MTRKGRRKGRMKKILTGLISATVFLGMALSARAMTDDEWLNLSTDCDMIYAVTGHQVTPNFTTFHQLHAPGYPPGSPVLYKTLDEKKAYCAQRALAAACNPTKTVEKNFLTIMTASPASEDVCTNGAEVTWNAVLGRGGKTLSVSSKGTCRMKVDCNKICKCTYSYK